MGDSERISKQLEDKCTATASITSWILKYVKAGWSIIPVRGGSKEPLIPWKEFQTRKASLEEIQEWLKKWPEMNIGVTTGRLSSIAVVDLDGLKGQAFGKLQKLVSCCTSVTGNGKQLFYKWTERVDNSASKIAPGVDIRGDGGFVVVPPSLHPNGKRYRWERFVPEQIQEFPKFLLKEKEINNSSTLQIGKSEGWIAKARPEGWIAKALEEMKIGNIDDTLISICGKLRRDNWTQEDALSILEPIALAKGATKGHLEAKIRNAWSRYESKQRLSPISSQMYSILNGELSIHSPADDDSFNKYSASIQSTGLSTGIKTGFPTLDKYFEGGLKSERLFTIAARTGTGKTNFAIALSANLCQQGKKVLFFSTEFRYEKIWGRYIATLKEPSRFREHAFYVCDSFSPSIERVEDSIKQIEPYIYIFDHINHIGEERESLGAFMQGCNFLQRKYNCQGVMVAQLNRQADWVEDGKRVEPRMSMIKGSGTIEQASSRVLLLSETRVTPEYNEIIGVLDKNDSGDRGIIQFALFKSPYIFKELI